MEKELQVRLDLLLKYENDRDYFQTLNTALTDLGPGKFFKLLEKAEKDGKRISVSMTDEQESIVADGGSVDGGYQYILK